MAEARTQAKLALAEGEPTASSHSSVQATAELPTANKVICFVPRVRLAACVGDTVGETGVAHRVGASNPAALIGTSRAGAAGGVSTVEGRRRLGEGPAERAGRYGGQATQMGVHSSGCRVGVLTHLP